MNPIILHVNYFEQGQDLPRIFELASSLGADGVEFRRYKPVYGLSPDEYLEEIARLKEQYRLPFTFFGGPQADRDLEAYHHFLEKADSLHLLSYVNLLFGYSEDPSIPVDLFHCDAHGYASCQKSLWEEVTSVTKTFARDFPHVRFAFETHMFYVHDTAKSARLLVDAIDEPNVGINLDYGNALFYEKTEPLSEALKIAGDRLFYTHMKNYQPISQKAGDLMPTALSQGALNHREYVRLLRQMKFEGPIGIEAPRPGDREWFAKEDNQYIRSLLES